MLSSLGLQLNRVSFISMSLMPTLQYRLTDGFLMSTNPPVSRGQMEPNFKETHDVRGRNTITMAPSSLTWTSSLWSEHLPSLPPHRLCHTLAVTFHDPTWSSGKRPNFPICTFKVSREGNQHYLPSSFPYTLGSEYPKLLYPSVLFPPQRMSFTLVFLENFYMYFKAQIKYHCLHEALLDYSRLKDFFS